MPAESSQTLDRGLLVVELLAGVDGTLSVTEIAARLRLSRPVVYRLVAALEAHRLVRREEDGRYRLGLGVLQLAARVLPLLRDAAVGPLRRLAEATGATAHLTVVDAGEALAVAVVEPTWTDLHVAYRVGSRHPVGAGAAGHAIVAGRRAPTAGDVVSSAGELQAGAHGVAAPVRGVPDLEASVGVVALARLDTDAVGPAVLRAAAEVAAALR